MPSRPFRAPRRAPALAVRAVLAAALVGCGERHGDPPRDADPGAAPTSQRLAAGSLVEPRGVVHDADADVYLVACGGGGAASISRIAADGSVVDPRWIDATRPGVELRAPDGLALVDGELWVADGDRVRRFDRVTGAPRAAIVVDGAAQLRDLAVGPGDFVHASDAAAIWRIAMDGSTATALLRGDDLGGPDGLAAAGNDLFVVTAGTGRFALVEPGGLRSGFALPTAGLDGLVRTADRRWFATSSVGRCVYAIEATGAATAIVAGLDGPTGLGLDATRGVLLVPLTAPAALATIPLPAPR